MYDESPPVEEGSNGNGRGERSTAELSVYGRPDLVELVGGACNDCASEPRQ
jgi:hypothetical protein